MVLSIRQLSLSEPATNYLYSSSTSSGTRRNHLGAAHGEEYNAWCNANGWINRFKATSKSGISATSELQAQVTPFSQRAFEDLLVNFITADDQVSIPAYGCFYQANFSSSRSMLSNAVNFETSFSSCARGCIFPIEPERKKSYLMHGGSSLLL